MRGVIFNKLNSTRKIFSVIMILIALIGVGIIMVGDSAKGEEPVDYGIVIKVTYSFNSGVMAIVSVNTKEGHEYKNEISATIETIDESIVNKTRNLVINIKDFDFETSEKIALNIVKETKFVTINEVHINYNNCSISTNKDGGCGIKCFTDLIINGENSNLTVESTGKNGHGIDSEGSITINSGSATINSTGVAGVGLYSKKDVNIVGTKRLVVNGGIGGDCAAIYAENNINISGGSIDATTKATNGDNGSVIKTKKNSLSSINISGGTLKATLYSENTTDADSATLYSSGVNITGGELEINAKGPFAKGIVTSKSGLVIGDENNADGISPIILIKGSIYGTTVDKQAEIKDDNIAAILINDSGNIILHDGSITINVNNTISYDYIKGIDVQNGTFTYNGGTLNITINNKKSTSSDSNEYASGDGICANDFIINEGDAKATIKVTGVSTKGRALYVKNTFTYKGGSMILQGAIRALQVGGTIDDSNVLTTLSGTTEYRKVVVASSNYDGSDPVTSNDTYTVSDIHSYKYLELGKQYLCYLKYTEKIGDTSNCALYKVFVDSEGKETTDAYIDGTISVSGTTIDLNNFTFNSIKNYGIKIELADTTKTVTINCAASSVNKISATQDSDNTNYAIHSNVSLNITGSGKLDVSGANETEIAYGIYLEDDKILTVGNGSDETKLNVYGQGTDDIGIRTNTDIDISSGTTLIKGKGKAVGYVGYNSDTEDGFKTSTNKYIEQVSVNYDGSEIEYNYDKTKLLSYKFIKTGNINTDYYTYTIEEISYINNINTLKGTLTYKGKPVRVNEVDGLDINISGKNIQINMNNFSFTTSAQYGIEIANPDNVEIKISLNISGTNNIITNSTDTSNPCYGIYFPADTTIKGSGTLNVSNISSSSIKYTGLYSKGSLSLTGGIYNIATGDNTIDSSYAIQSEGALTVNGVESLTAQGKNGAISCSSLTVNGVSYVSNNYDGSGAAEVSRPTLTSIVSKPYVKIITKIISVDIIWGDMTFDTTKIWEPSTHTYSYAFTPSLEDSNIIQVDNRLSTIPINTKLKYTAINSSTIGTFLDVANNTTFNSDEIKTIKQSARRNFKLALSGELNTDDTVIGSVTITLSE